MKKLMLMLVAACVVGGVLAMPAMARGGKGKGTPHGFKAIDANGDGKITFEEFKAYHEAKAAAKGGKHHKGKGGKKHETLQQRFDERDQNHDGAITKAEWKATKKHHHKKGSKTGATGATTTAP